jgi:hypothetical protein
MKTPTGRYHSDHQGSQMHNSQFNHNVINNGLLETQTIEINAAISRSINQATIIRGVFIIIL